MNKLKRIWYFFWKDDSLWSWLANIVIAFLVIRYVLYPVLGIILGTPFPIVAVVSESMEHGLHNGEICGKSLDKFQESFVNYWEECGEWYQEEGISRSEFETFPFRDGFNKGDVIILWRPNKIEIGDILIFEGNRPQPIIHRVVKKIENNEETFYQTKGDHNSKSIESGTNETKISKERVYGKGLIRIPYLGWIKILAVDGLKLFGISIVR